MKVEKNNLGSLSDEVYETLISSVKKVRDSEDTKVLKESLEVIMFKNDDGHLIKLYPSAHIGTEEFYESRNRELIRDFEDGFEIHHEGVKPEKLKDGSYDYSLNEMYLKLANSLGFSIQGVPKNVKINNFDADLMEENFFVRKIFTQASRVFSFMVSKAIDNLKYLDYDDSKKEVLKLRDAVLDTVSGSASGELVSSKLFFAGPINRFIVDRRNEIAITNAVRSEKNVSLVWGKAHVVGMTNLLLMNGYTWID